ncbi:MAG: hypothetical protein AAF961_01590 [Planctomycetota bacterium]
MPTTMATTEALSSDVADDYADPFEYRPLSTRAVAAAVLSLLSLLIFVAGRDSLQASLMLSPLALLGLFLGGGALAAMRANPGQYTGGKIAWAGIVISLFSLFGGIGFAGYVFATEVPDGYIRTSFTKMRPDEVDVRGGRAVPEDIAALDGEQVFIKGYIRPDSTRVRTNLKRFLLVRDNNQCCFGDAASVKYYDQIGVAVDDGVAVDYSSKLFRLGGKLRVNEEAVRRGGSMVFTLEADYAK